MSLYNKLNKVQLKNLTSSELMKLGQLTFVDLNSVGTLNQLKNIQTHAENLVTPGNSVFADSLQFFAQTANANSKDFKPSDIYSSEPFASTYLIEVLAIGATVGGGDTATIAVSLTDGSNSLMLLKPTNVTLSGPLTFEPTAPLLINEGHYLQVANSASVDCTITVYCGIKARGGSQ